MRRIKILMIVLVLMLSGCVQYHLKYQSHVKLKSPITQKTKISIRLPAKIPLDIMRESVSLAIYRDLIQNVFVNPVKEDPDILCFVDVVTLEANEALWGLLWAPLALFGVPASKMHGKVFITLKLSDPSGKDIKTYSEPYSRQRWASIYSSNTLIKWFEDLIKKAMERLKNHINNDRDEIIAAIEKKKPVYAEAEPRVSPQDITSPPKLTFSYEIRDANRDKVFNGGERVGLRVKVSNQGKGTALGVRVLLSGNSTVLNYLGKEKFLGNIPPNGEKYTTFEALLPYKIEYQDASVIIRITEERGFDALKEAEFTVAIQPAKIEREKKVLSTLVDVDYPLTASSFKIDNAYAVVIGISDYRESSIPDVKYAKRDAEMVKIYLENVCGVRPENIFTFYDDRASIGDFMDVFEDKLPKKLDKNAILYIYYAGHGTPGEKGETYLVPYDGRLGSKRTLYPLQDLYKAVNKLPIKEAVIILDACFSGEGRSVLAMGKRPLVPVKLTRMIAKPKFVVLSAADAEQTSNDYENKRHGLFTYYLLKGLRGKADNDNNGWIELGELYDYVKKNVYKVARNELYTDQTPKILPEGILSKKSELRIGRCK
ncbi:caspase family protein [candidate division WOR-3 bacterium]|nr:caspase family protein [candidate division WOR-3 bacterium]